MTSPAAFPSLTEDQFAVVLEVAKLLASRFNGTIEITCGNGGVKNFRDIRDRRVADLGANDGERRGK